MIELRKAKDVMQHGACESDFLSSVIDKIKQNATVCITNVHVRWAFMFLQLWID